MYFIYKNMFFNLFYMQKSILQYFKSNIYFLKSAF